MAQQPEPGRPDGCWGCLVHRCGWTSDTGYKLGWCYKKARPGKLTCWSHRGQEADAQRLRTRLEEHHHV